MNRLFLFAALATLLFTTSCGKNNANETADASPAAAAANNPTKAPGFNAGANFRRTGTLGYSQAISVDTANMMIQSYLTSVGYPQQDNNLRSLVFDADVLRKYLADPNIKSIKCMFAHQPDYIAAGNYGVNAGMNPDVMTMILVGVGSDASYIKNVDNKVYEHWAPCPKECGMFNGSATIE